MEKKAKRARRKAPATKRAPSKRKTTAKTPTKAQNYWNRTVSIFKAGRQDLANVASDIRNEVTGTARREVWTRLDAALDAVGLVRKTA